MHKNIVSTCTQFQGPIHNRQGETQLCFFQAFHPIASGVANQQTGGKGATVDKRHKHNRRIVSRLYLSARAWKATSNNKPSSMYTCSKSMQHKDALPNKSADQTAKLSKKDEILVVAPHKIRHNSNSENNLGILQNTKCLEIFKEALSIPMCFQDTLSTNIVSME